MNSPPINFPTIVMQTAVLAAPFIRPPALTSAAPTQGQLLTTPGACYLLMRYEQELGTTPQFEQELLALPLLELDIAGTKKVWCDLRNQASDPAWSAQQFGLTPAQVAERMELIWHLIREFHEEACLSAAAWLRGAAAEAALEQLFDRQLQSSPHETVVGYYAKAGGFTCFDTRTGELDCRIVWTRDEVAAQRWLLRTISAHELPGREGQAL